MTETLGASPSISISLPDCYWDVLSTMAEIQGRTVEDLATKRLKQMIIEDVTMDRDLGGLYGVLMAQGWLKTLQGDQFFKEVMGGK